MSGSHVAPSSRHSNNNSNHSGSGWKVAILVIVLLISIAALGFLLWQLFGERVMGLIGGESNDTATVAPGIFTQIDAKYSNGKNVAGNLTVSQGTQRPEQIPAEAEDVVLLDINWTGSKEQTEPVYLTVSDPSFTDGDGLSVYEYDQPQASWEQVGTYRIQNNSVTFQAGGLSSFAFQVISSKPEPTPMPTSSPEPSEPAQPTQEPSPTPEPTPEPTPQPAVAVDYGSYPTVQTGAFTLATELADGERYVVAMVADLPADAVPVVEQTSENTGSSGDSGSSGEVDFSYVDAPAGGTTTGDAAATAAPVANTPRATVLINKGDNSLGAVEMPLVQAENGSWCLAGPVTEGMLWTADKDIYYGGESRFSLGNNERYLNTDDSLSNIILTDNSVRTRWLVESATLSNGSRISTITYGGDSHDIHYITSLGNVVETITDSLFPVGEVPAEPNPQAAQVTYLGTVPPADQTLLRETMRFTIGTDQAQAQQVLLFKLDPSAVIPAGTQTMPTCSITLPIIDENTDLSTLDIRDGTSLLQLGVDYTVAAKVYNNSTVVVVISFMGKYTGQIVRTYPGTFFRSDANQAAPTASPEPSATPTPTGGGTGSGNGGGGTGWVPPSTGGSTDSPTDSTTYDDPTDG